MKKLSGMNILKISVIGWALMIGGTYLYEFHLPGFTPKNLPCGNNPPMLTLEDGSQRDLVCIADKKVWSEVWQKRGDRWVRLSQTFNNTEKLKELY
jgi:hypothetical protein